MTGLLDTAPDTPTPTLEHPTIRRSAPAGRSRNHRLRGRRRGEENAVVGVLLLAIAVMIAALGYLAGGPPLRRTVPLGRAPETVTTTTLSSRGTSPTARREASPATAPPPTLGAVAGDTQPQGSPSRVNTPDPGGSGAQSAVERPEPAGAPVPAADPPAATTATSRPPAAESPPETTTTGPPPTSPPPTEPPPVIVPVVEPQP